MEEKKFIEKMAEILEEEITTVKMESRLDSFDAWDSLARITFIVFVSDEHKKRLDGSAVKDAVFVSDLYSLATQ